MSRQKSIRSVTAAVAAVALALPAQVLGRPTSALGVAETRWGPVEQVSAQAEKARPYRGGPWEVVATGAGGRAVAAWTHGVEARLYASVRRPEHGWSRRTALSSSPVSNYTYDSYDAAIGAHRIVSVVWVERRPEGGRRLWEAHRKAGSWTAPARITDRVNRGGVDVIVDRSGTTVVAWAGPDGVRVSRRGPRGTWSRPEQVAPRRGTRPMVETNGGGDLVVAWSATSQGKPVVRAAVQEAGRRWGPATTVVRNQHAYLSDLAVGPRAQALVMWTTYRPRGDTSGVGWVRRRASGSWTAPAYLSRELGEGVGGGVTLSMNRKGQAVATWKQVPGGGGGDGEPVEVVATTFRLDHTWTPVQRLLRPAGYLQPRQQAWMDGAGGAHVVVGRGRRIWSFDRLPTGAWTRDLVSNGYLTAADGHGGAATVLYLRVDKPHVHRVRTGQAGAG